MKYEIDFMEFIKKHDLLVFKDNNGDLLVVMSNPYCFTHFYAIGTNFIVVNDALQWEGITGKSPKKEDELSFEELEKLIVGLDVQLTLISSNQEFREIILAAEFKEKYI